MRIPRPSAVARLLRISLAPSAVADIVAGCVLGRGGLVEAPAVASLALGSLFVYHGAMCWNDWADRAQDLQSRPRRPLPSGQVSPGFALGLGTLLLVAGPLLPAIVLYGSRGVAPALALLAVALLAVFYDLAGRGPWLGPLLLALCRAGNLGAGMLLGLGRADASPALLAAPALYAGYVFLVSRLGRLEDGEEAIRTGWDSPRRLLGAAGLLLLLPPLLPAASLPAAPGAPLRTLLFVLHLVLASGLWRALRKTPEPDPVRIRGWMGLALARLIAFDAGLALLAGGLEQPLPGLGLLLLFPLSGLLARRFPPS